jgi:SAM-dependent methyltransferase
MIDSVPVGGAVLDAPCGTGRYLDATLAAGRNVMGIDLSAGMLAQARAKHPEVALERIRLQDLGFEAAFDAAICVDAMEYVPPEDWPTVRPPAGPSRRWTRGARRLASTPVAQCTAVHGRPAGAMQGAAPGQGATGGHGGAPSQPAPGAD